MTGALFVSLVNTPRQDTPYYKQWQLTESHRCCFVMPAPSVSAIGCSGEKWDASIVFVRGIGLERLTGRFEF